MLIPRSEVLRGSEFEHDAPSLGRKKVAHVQLPSGRPPLAGFRVCYLLHSFGGDRHSWARQGDGFLTGLASDVLFVFPESGRRWFMNDASGKRYEDYLLADLIPAIEATYPVERSARSRIIGGFSMGGAGAIHLALRNPGVFSRAFAVAGAFYASERQGDPYASMRRGACMMPTEQEHDRVSRMPTRSTLETMAGLMRPVRPPGCWGGSWGHQRSSRMLPTPRSENRVR